MSEHAGENDRVSVNVDLKPHDVYTPFRWSARNLFYWVLVLAGSWVVYDSYRADPERWHFGTIPRPVAAMGAFTILLLVLFVSQYLLVLRLFQKYPAFKNPRNLRFGPEGIHVESENVCADYKWPLFSRVQETRKTFYFLQTANAAMHVPKRCFTSPSDIARLRELVREHFKGPWRLRRG